MLRAIRESSGTAIAVSDEALVIDMPLEKEQTKKIVLFVLFCIILVYEACFH